MDKNLDELIKEALKAYLASGVENQVDYQKLYLYSTLTHFLPIQKMTLETLNLTL